MATRYEFVSYTPYYRGIGEMLRAEFMQEEMRRRAVLGMANAITISPVDTGEYIESFEVDAGVKPSLDGTLRAYGQLSNTAPHAAHVEFGKGGDQHRAGPGGHHVLLKSLDVMGGDI